jgi:hypothetical protein
VDLDFSSIQKKQGASNLLQNQRKYAPSPFQSHCDDFRNFSTFTIHEEKSSIRLNILKLADFSSLMFKLSDFNCRSGKSFSV